MSLIKAPPEAQTLDFNSEAESEVQLRVKNKDTFIYPTLGKFASLKQHVQCKE